LKSFYTNFAVMCRTSTGATNPPSLCYSRNECKHSEPRACSLQLVILQTVSHKLAGSWYCNFHLLASSKLVGHHGIYFIALHE